MATMNAGPAKIERQISLPFNRAFKIALRNITVRLGRAMITGAGTMLGIAFLMSVFTAPLLQEATVTNKIVQEYRKKHPTALPGSADERKTVEEEKKNTAVIDIAQTQKHTWLVVMSLLVSAVGITNSMLMSVTERYKEIGTMKCLGALDSFIVKLFLHRIGNAGLFRRAVWRADRRCFHAAHQNFGCWALFRRGANG